MENIEVLNTYACLGGNRLKWTDCRVTAVEKDEKLAELYQKRFPNDIVIIGDAHEYLRCNFKKFQFIWSSPPCQTHSRAGLGARVSDNLPNEPVYPDMKLYEEILFLQSYFKGLYCVENVIPFYEPLIKAQRRGRHLYWCNFTLPHILSNRNSKGFMDSNKEMDKWCKFHQYDFRQYKGKQLRIKIARNLVDYEAGNTIFETAKRIINGLQTKQIGLFDGL